MFDPDGSGLMDVEDLKAGSRENAMCSRVKRQRREWSEGCEITMRALGCEVRKAEMKRIISEVDQNGSRKINFESFLRVMTQKMAEPFSKEEIRKGFKLFDYDGTGKISFEKLKLVAGEVEEDITDEELQEMIDEADVDGDGEVDLEEFLRILTLTDL